MADRETELREQLAVLRRRYQDEAQPIIDEITKIEAMKPRVPIMVYADLLPGLARKGHVQQVMHDLANVHALTRNWVDELGKDGISITRTHGDGTVERIAPEDFYAKPEGKCFVCGAVGDADHLGHCSESW